MRIAQSHRRRGMTMVLVLGVLTVTLALSYAIMRTQVTSAQIQDNLSHSEDARQAALTGLEIGLRKMRQSSWAGVDTQFGGMIELGTLYIVHYGVGDAELLSGDPNYDKYPFRVTVTSTGYTVDYTTGLVTSTYVAESVVELVPRALSTQPANWDTLQNYTAYQWEDQDVVIQTPVRVEGPVALQGPVKLCENYPPTSRPWDGEIDEVAIYDRALSQAEIQAIHSVAPSGKLALASEIISFSPAHYWGLDEVAGSSVAIDATGSGNGTYENGTQAGVTGAVSGSTCAEFDGINDHINVGNLDISGDEITILAFFKADSWDASPYARIVSKATGTTNSEHYWMLSTAPSGGNIRIRSRIRTGGSTSYLVASSGNLTTDTWYLAAAVYDGTDMILYLNGNEVGRRSKSGNLDQNPNVPVYIGESPPGSPQTRLLRDLEAKRVAGEADWRPLEGPIETPHANTDASTLVMLQEDLNLTVTDVAANNSAPVAHPGTVATYQLYTGGPTYSVQALSSGNLSSDLEADPQTNPLGVYQYSGTISVQDGVTIIGTIITTTSSSDIDIAGDNVALSPVSLPALYGTTEPVELPVAIVGDDFLVDDIQGGQLNGAIFAADKFVFESGSQDASCSLSGMLLAGELQVEDRSEWASVTSGQWESRLTDFVNQLSGGSPEPYFPDWLADNYSLASEPKLTIARPSAGVNYHWHDWTQPVFVPHADDAGLLWKVIRTTESP